MNPSPEAVAIVDHFLKNGGFIRALMDFMGKDGEFVKAWLIDHIDFALTDRRERVRRLVDAARESDVWLERAAEHAAEQPFFTDMPASVLLKLRTALAPFLQEDVTPPPARLG